MYLNKGIDDIIYVFNYFSICSIGTFVTIGFPVIACGSQAGVIY